MQQVNATGFRRPMLAAPLAELLLLLLFELDRMLARHSSQLTAAMGCAGLVPIFFPAASVLCAPEPSPPCAPLPQRPTRLG